MRLNVVIVLNLLLISFSYCEEKPKKPILKKNLNDMTDAEFERIFDQWEENEEQDPDDVPEYQRPRPQIDLSQVDTSNPDNLIRATKQGQNVMMFVDVRKDLSEDEVNDILRIWQGNLRNNHIVAERYPIDGKRAIFMFREGSQAIDAKNYLIEQPELENVTLEGQVYHGVHYKEKPKEKKKSKKTEL